MYWEGLLHWLWRPEGTSPGHVRIVSSWCVVLRLAHDIPLAGHLGIKKTRERVLQRYYWPGISDVATYCRTSEVCQRSQSQCPTKAKIMTMPLISKTFQRIAMDSLCPSHILKPSFSMKFMCETLHPSTRGPTGSPTLIRRQ